MYRSDKNIGGNTTKKSKVKKRKEKKSTVKSSKEGVRGEGRSPSPLTAFAERVIFNNVLIYKFISPLPPYS